MEGWLHALWNWVQAHPMATSLAVAGLAALAWYATRESAAEKAGREAAEHLKRDSADRYRDLRPPQSKEGR